MREVSQPSSFASTAARVLPVPGRGSDPDEDARNLCRRVGLQPAATVLDVGGGQGRHAAALQRLGYGVAGIDRSAEQGGYDLVLDTDSRLGCFGSQDEDLGALKACHSKLKTDGWLVMVLAETGPDPHPNEGARPSVNLENEDIRKAAPLVRSAEALATAGELGGVGQGQPGKRVYSIIGVIGMLHAAGFGHVQVFGSFSGSAKRPEDPAVIVAQNC